MTHIRSILYGVAMLLLFYLPTACQSEKMEEASGPFDPDARIESTLGNITLTGEPADTRAATYKLLGDGETFRLYALRRGVTDMQQIVTSYTYTMQGGKAVMDSGQGDGKLYLPYGDLDIYLVGPVSAPSQEVDANGKPLTVHVAGPTGVIPRQGVDLIASCTPVTINYTGANKVNPTPLKHKMAKVRVRVNRNSDKYVMMKYLKLTKVELYNQYEGVGTYTFDADGGIIAPLAPDSVGGMSVIAENQEIKQLEANKEYYADFMLLPRQAGYQKIEVEMDITLTNNEETPYRMSGITRDIEFVAGKQNLLFTEPEVSNDIVWRPELLPWDQEEPIAPAMGGDMIVYLDGRDAPEMINGKLCWRDRSGNGNHAEIPVSSGITYNAERMCYEFATGNDRMQLPDLGYIPDYTLEIVAQSMQDGGTAVQFEGTGGDHDNRCLFVHLPYSDGITYFDSGEIGNQKTGRLSTTISTDQLYGHSFRTYYFQKSTTNQRMTLGVNGVSKATDTKISKHGAFTTNHIGGKEYLKIRSLRLYRKVLLETDIKINYNVDKTVYQEEPDIATNGLILHLDGKVPPIISNGNTYWTDISGGGHHARYLHFPSGKNHIVYTGRGYRFNNVNASDYSMMELISSLGTLTGNQFTLEIVTASENARATVFYTGPNTSTGDRTIGIHLPFPPGAGTIESRIVFDGPRYNNGNPQDRITYTGPYVSLNFTSKMHYYAFTRSRATGNSFNRLVVDGQEIARLDNSTNNLDLKEMKYTYIGNLNGNHGDWFTGEICAIRLYNRALTPEEILKNSRADKARYKY